jgi:integrase/recombinase XerD
MRLSQAIRQYVARKQLFGIRFIRGRQVLQAFYTYVGEVRLRSVAKWQVRGFLERSGSSDVTWLLRYRLLKAFFEHWMARDELQGLPIPPSRHPGTARIFVPYIYSVSELRQLLDGAALKRTPNSREFGPLTFRTVLLFLYGTGARINETLCLKLNDVDLKRGTVTFGLSTANRTRVVPVGVHLRRSLRDYVDSLELTGSDRANFFARENGRPIQPRDLHRRFQTLRRKVAISRPADSSRQPRVQDLRWTFAVHCMRAWLKEGKDLRIMLPILGAYLGHVSLTSTETYLAVTPERFLAPLSRLSGS